MKNSSGLPGLYLSAYKVRPKCLFIIDELQYNELSIVEAKRHTKEYGFIFRVNIYSHQLVLFSCKSITIRYILHTRHSRLVASFCSSSYTLFSVCSIIVAVSAVLLSLLIICSFNFMKITSFHIFVLNSCSNSTK